jgi:AcrR family transcriptional regulator
MERKQIQEQRIKNYFIQATKDLLKGEGLRTVSVRNIADRAGYSYATLYNYFKDVKDLVFECVKDFQEECEEMIITETKDSPQGLGKIKAITKSYIKYFVQYPGIFELFYTEKVTELQNKQQTVEMINTFLDKLTNDEWNYCITNSIVSMNEAMLKRSQLKYLVTGLLLLYISRRHPSSYQDFMNDVESQLNSVLGS